MIKIGRYVYLVLLLSVSIWGMESLREKIANMFMLGFTGTDIERNSSIMRDICERGLGGVILFDKATGKKGARKNIVSPAQLRRLAKKLSSCSKDLLISVDQEGGLVQRLKSVDGFFGKYPRASVVAAKGEKYARKIYAQMARELKKNGINMNLAPVADLALNPNNRVIVKYGRSYGSDPKSVFRYDAIFIDAMHRYGVLTALKHFPGHGSSSGDTHKGFVDATAQWKKKEIEPYRLLIDRGGLDAIMVAHIFNRTLDERFPASLSRKIIRGILRKRLGFKGVVMTDDLQMSAVSKHYSLRDTIMYAIRAGNDILLFGNQLDSAHGVRLKRLVDITLDLLRQKKIDIEDIELANRRIEAMKKKIGRRLLE